MYFKEGENRELFLNTLIWSIFSLLSLPLSTLASSPFYQPGDTLLPQKYITTAEAFNRSKSYDSSRYYYQLAANEFAASEKWNNFFEAQNKVGYSLSVQLKYKESFIYLDSIEREFSIKLNPKMPAYQWLYRGLAWAQFRLIKYEEAIGYLDKIRLGVDPKPDTIDSNTLFEKYYRGVIFQRLGQYDLALKNMLDARAFSEKVGAEGTLASTYNNLGIIYRNLGEYERALEYYQKSYILGKERWPEVNLTPVNNNIGTLYFYLEEYDLALDELNYGLRVLNNHTKNYFGIETSLTNSKAFVLIEQLAFDSAELILLRVLEREKAKFNTVGINSVRTITTLGDLFSKKNEINRAIAYYDQAIDAFDQSVGIKNDKVADIYNKKGKALFKANKYLEAARAHQLALTNLVSEFNDTELKLNPDMGSTIFDKVVLAETLYLKAKSLANQYHKTLDHQILEIALASNLMAQQLVEQIRDNMIYESSVVTFSQKVNEVYEQGIELLLSDRADVGIEEKQTILSDMEQSKAYILAESILRAKNLGYSNMSQANLAIEDSFKIEIKLLENQQRTIISGSNDSLKLAEIHSELFKVKEHFEAFLLSATPNKASIKARNPSASIQIGSIQKNLNTHELVIEYFAGSENLYAIAIGKAEVEVYQLGDYENKLKEFSTFLLQLRSSSAREYQSMADDLYQHVLAPILTDFDRVNSILIIPDRQLGYIPFDALVKSVVNTPEYNSLDYLLKRYTIFQHQSLAIYFSNQSENKRPEENYIGYAPNFNEVELSEISTESEGRISRSLLQPLPYAEEEVCSISTILDGEIATGNLANEKSFKASTKSFNILHIATHAIINEDHPIYSRLIFASPDSSSGEDGLLHSYEIYGLNIQSDLVTLSACNTGSGKYFAGEGIFSLGRGFLMAGARSVLTSLWEVADLSTSQIMEMFYTNLKRGDTKPEALRQAKLEYLKSADPLTANPHYWAAFVYIGKSDSVYKSNYTYYWVGGFLLILGFWAMRKKFL